MVQQPFFKLKNRMVEGGEAFLLVRRRNSGSGFDDGGNEKRFVDIDATAGWINDFHRQSSLYCQVIFPLKLRIFQVTISDE